MFQTADQLLIEKNEDRFPLHVLDFSWDGFEPALECYDSRSSGVSDIDLEDFSFSVGKKRICVGQFTKEGAYKPCPDHAIVDKVSQCPKCSRESFLPDQECVFNPKCDGVDPKCGAAESAIEFCRREHVLYVAFYNTRMKIGMSSTRRVEKRLIEQGADAFAILGKARNRLEVRKLENEMSSRLGIPQALKQNDLLGNLVRKVDEDAIRERYQKLLYDTADISQLAPEEVRWLDGYPIELPLESVPRLQESFGKHKGRLVGVKGKWAIYESHGLRALNLSHLPARFLSRD
jgi:hypothetical protein